MTKGVRFLKSNTIVKTTDLAMFLDDFRDVREMIDALIDLHEFVLTHPDFGRPTKLLEARDEQYAQRTYAMSGSSLIDREHQHAYVAAGGSTSL